MAIRPSSFRVLGGDVIPTPTGVITTQVIAAPDPLDIELQLLEIAGNIERTSQPLLAAAAVARHDIQERFNTETDPDQDSWIPLDEEYLLSKRSKGFPDDILHMSGDLENSATAVGAFKVVGDSLFFDTSGLPPYGLLHQTRSGDPFVVGIAAQHRYEARADAEHKRKFGGPHSNQAIGRGQALPARPFIGMSEDAEAEVWKIFDLWFEEATSVQYAVSSAGTLQHRVSGRFGPKVVL